MSENSSKASVLGVSARLLRMACTKKIDNLGMARHWGAASEAASIPLKVGTDVCHYLY